MNEKTAPDPTASAYIYLHGFASSPHSRKGMDLYHRFASQGIDLIIPDLNQGGFTQLTLTRQIQQVSDLIADLPSSRPITLIGSSLGGLVAAWVAERHHRVRSVILLAPAFQFLDHWLERLGAVQLQQWQTDGTMPVFHYGENQPVPLAYTFLTDARRYPDQQLQRSVPTLVLHGVKDEVVPIEASRAYARSRAWVELIELASDHALTDALDPIWESMKTWCHLP